MSERLCWSGIVSVCIATYQRPLGLGALLSSLASLEMPVSTTIEVIVVDNNPDASVSSAEAEAVARFGAAAGVRTVYEVQPKPNISTTRNMAVSLASGDALWFLDDDQLVTSNCLIELLRALGEIDADGVSGTVRALFETDPPDWIKRSSIFNRPVEEPGQPTRAMGIANTLILRDALARVEGPFDERFGSTGGEDSMLFRRLTAQKVKLVASPDAVVEECVPGDRVNWEWMKDRRRRQGQNYLRQIVLLSGGRFSAASLTAAALAILRVLILRLQLLFGSHAEFDQSERRQRLESNLGKLEGWRGTSTDWVGSS